MMAFLNIGDAKAELSSEDIDKKILEYITTVDSVRNLSVIKVTLKLVKDSNIESLRPIGRAGGWYNRDESIQILERLIELYED